MRWQILSESIFAELWNLVKNLQKPGQGLMKKESCGILSCLLTITYISNQQWLWEQQSALLMAEEAPRILFSKNCNCGFQPISATWRTSGLPWLTWLWNIPGLEHLCWNHLIDTVAWGKEQQLGQGRNTENPRKEEYRQCYIWVIRTFIF